MGARNMPYLEGLSLIISAMYRLYYAGRIPPGALTYGRQTVWRDALE